MAMTVPLAGPLHAQRDQIVELADLGYTAVWSAETDGHDAFTILALASVWVPSLRLGTAIVPAYTRGPACLAQTVSSMAQAAPGRFSLGIGSSSNVIVEGWNGIPFVEPYRRTRDYVRFLRTALAGDRVATDFDTFSIRGFSLKALPPEPVPILVAALREGMLRMAGREADGAIVNWLSANDVASVAPIVHAAAGSGLRKEVVCRIFCAPIDDPGSVRAVAKPLIAAYLNVPVYRAFHEWLGRTELQPMWDAWDQGDRKGAVAAIPDAVVDDLIVHGSPSSCREQIDRYVAAGVTTPVVALLPVDLDARQAARDLAPR